MRKYTLDEVLLVLNIHRRSATYGAVAEVVGGIARGVVRNVEPNTWFSWIVDANHHWPNWAPRGGHDPKNDNRIDPRLRHQHGYLKPISSGRELLEFLNQELTPTMLALESTASDQSLARGKSRRVYLQTTDAPES